MIGPCLQSLQNEFAKDLCFRFQTEVIITKLKVRNEQLQTALIKRNTG